MLAPYGVVLSRVARSASRGPGEILGTQAEGFAHIGPQPVSRSPGLVRIRVEVCRSGAESGKSLSNSGQVCAEFQGNFGPDRQFGCRVRPVSTTFGPGPTTFGPSSAKLGLTWLGVGQTWPRIDESLARIRPHLARCRPSSAKHGPSLARFRPIWGRVRPNSAGTRPNLAEFDRLRPNLARNRPTWAAELGPNVPRTRPNSTAAGPNRSTSARIRSDAEGRTCVRSPARSLPAAACTRPSDRRPWRPPARGGRQERSGEARLLRRAARVGLQRLGEPQRSGSAGCSPHGAPGRGHVRRGGPRAHCGKAKFDQH